MNKKGQIGKIITSFPAIIGIFLVILIFLLIIGFGKLFGASQVKTEIPEFILKSYRAETNQDVNVNERIFLQTVDYKGTKMRAIEAIVIYRDKMKDLMGPEIYDYFNPLVKALGSLGAESSINKDENYCFYFYSNELDIANLPPKGPSLLFYGKQGNLVQVNDESQKSLVNYVSLLDCGRLVEKSDSYGWADYKPISFQYYYGPCIRARSGNSYTNEFEDKCVKTGKVKI